MWRLQRRVRHRVPAWEACMPEKPTPRSMAPQLGSSASACRSDTASRSKGLQKHKRSFTFITTTTLKPLWFFYSNKDQSSLLIVDHLLHFTKRNMTIKDRDSTPRKIWLTVTLASWQLTNRLLKSQNSFLNWESHRKITGRGKGCLPTTTFIPSMNPQGQSMASWIKGPRNST